MIEEVPEHLPGDLATNLALTLAKRLQKSARDIAQSLVREIGDSSAVHEALAVAGSGFLNFTLRTARLQNELSAILQEGARYGGSRSGGGEKILVEFVSANPTGPLHVGHGRGAAIGDSLARVLKHLGHAVSTEYYVNDAGQQVELLGASVKARCGELRGQAVSFPEEGYHGDYVREIARQFLRQHPEAKGEEPSAIAFALEDLLEAQERDLKDFGVTFDRWFRETDLLAKGWVDQRVQFLRERGHVSEHDGAVWFVMPGQEEEKDKDRVLKRGDGRWTYFATDVAYHADKFQRGFDRLINVWGADHHGYVPRVKASLAALGQDPQRLQVVLYQLVSLSRGGKPVSMSKRSGDFVTLREVLEEVGRDACRFFFALRSPNTALDFDLELAKKQSLDNPVYYVQYSHARICSIFREAEKTPLTLPSPSRGEGGGEGGFLAKLTEPEERGLMRRLAFFSQVLRSCVRECSPHPLANNLLTLARQFHHYYDHHRVLVEDKDLARARLALCSAVRQVLANGLTLLGVSAPEKM